MKTEDLYFCWLVSIVNAQACYQNYSKLLSYLNEYEYEPCHDLDVNRLQDGISLRERFVSDTHLTTYAKDLFMIEQCYIPCSVLEMMVALSLRIEEDIMGESLTQISPERWFGVMLDSTGLFRYTDDNFNKELINTILRNFMSNNYQPNGVGGLFAINGHADDLRTVDIWTQMCWYLNTIC